MCLAAAAACSFSRSDGVVVDGSTDDARPPDAPDAPDTSGRVQTGLVGYWRFDEASGALASDVAAPPTGKAAMNLTIADPAMVTHMGGGLRLDGRVPGGILSAQRPHLNEAVTDTTGAVTFEAWVSPANATQGAGVAQGQPNYAFVFGSSATYVYRNAMIAQVGDHWQGRVATLNTSANGVPAIDGGSVVVDAPTHLVLVASATERKLYVNGTAFTSTPDGVGSLQGMRPTTPPSPVWDEDYKLSLGDEVAAASDRHWLGTIWLVAVYDRALSQDDVTQNFVATHSCIGC